MTEKGINYKMSKDYKITKPVRLIELFSGYQSQFMAMKRLGVDCVSWRTSEWDVNSTRSAHAVHCPEDTKDYSENFSKEQVIDTLFKLGISNDGKEPLAKDKIARKSEKWLRDTFNDFAATKNLGSITNIHAKSLKIKDQDKYEYLLTYSFPCFTGDTLVLTKDGYKEIKDINIGDYVLTHDNTYQKVLNSQYTGEKEIYKINAMGVDEIKCTSNHKFYVREMYRTYPRYENGKRGSIRHFKEPEWVECKDLTKKYYLGIAINQESIMPQFDNELIYNHSFWYLVGRYVGDGWHQQNSIIICGNEAKIEELVTHIKNCNFVYRISKNRTCLKVSINSLFLKEITLLFGKGAKNKTVPGFLFDMPIIYIESFLCGYFGADGCYTQSAYKYVSISKKLIYSMAQLVAKTYKTTYRIYKTVTSDTRVIEDRVVNQNDWYEIRYKRNKSKQDKAFYENGYIWYPINKIENTNSIESVYDISVENNHSFTANGTIVHNCQDISLAGQQRGFDKDSGTRSALLWEVERILRECKEEHCMPDILLMENVKAIINKKNMENFQKWLNVLKELGYSSYYQVLNAKDYGVPQNRERVFCLSILGDYTYTFPEPIPLKKRLKDVLEDHVSEKYYINTEKADKLIGNLIDRGVLPREREREREELISQQEEQISEKLQTVSRQFKEELSISHNQKQELSKIVMTANMNNNMVAKTDTQVAKTLCARDWKGFGTGFDTMNGVIEGNE